MLSYNEIKERKYIILGGDPYEVLKSQVSRKQAQKPTNQTKLRNLISQNVVEKNFHSSENVEEAEVFRKKAFYIFPKFNRQTSLNEYWFHDTKDKSNRYMIPAKIIEEKIKFIKENSEIELLMFEDDDGNEIPISVVLPIKIKLKVVEAPPAVKGNTATGANKLVVTETGLTVTTPIFINEGDYIIVNTTTGAYVERG